MIYEQFAADAKSRLAELGGRGGEVLCVGDDGRFAFVDLDIGQMVQIFGVEIPPDVAATAKPYAEVTGWR
jgi:hypothetical protein